MMALIDSMSWQVCSENARPDEVSTSHYSAIHYLFLSQLSGQYLHSLKAKIFHIEKENFVNYACSVRVCQSIQHKGFLLVCQLSPKLFVTELDCLFWGKMGLSFKPNNKEANFEG